MYDENGVYKSEDMFVRLKANIINLLTEDDDAFSANIVEDLFKTIDAIKIRLDDADAERNMFRRRALKAELDLRRAAEKNVAEQ